jgi:hypothetical protein
MNDEAVRILVLDRGWVVVGVCPHPSTVGMWLPVKGGRVIRRWGTSKGIEEIAAKGPLSGTTLDDPAKEQTIPVRAIIRVIEVEEAKWKAHVKGS